VVDQTPDGSRKTLEAITPVNGMPPGCAQVQSAWASNGYWKSNPRIDLYPPAGGVYGAAGIVNVAQGTLYAYDATAIDGFSDVAQHTGPDDPKPNFSTAVTDSVQGIAAAYVPIGNAMIKAQYPSGTRGADAVSAVLMADKLFNEYQTDPNLGASSEWVATFPTKQFYVDPAIVGTSYTSYLPPFEETFGGGSAGGHPGDPGVACFRRSFRYFDREGDTPTNSGCLGLCPVVTNQYLCYETELITFNQNWVEPGVPTSIFGSLVAINVPTSYNNGWFELTLSIDAQQALRPSVEGNTFTGMPVAGFLAVNYINANVTPGVLSNYSAVYPHRSGVGCTNSTNPQSTCQ
jgi:hypothetical protein